MIKAIEKLVGKEVTVGLRVAISSPVKGKLVECDNMFLVLEQKHGELVIPLTSVLHIAATPTRATKR